jgi:hypothetical protein
MKQTRADLPQRTLDPGGITDPENVLNGPE